MASLREVIPEANIAIFGPPPVRGVGRAGGWMLMIEDRGDLGSGRASRQVETLVNQGNAGIDLDGEPIKRGAHRQPRRRKSQTSWPPCERGSSRRGRA